MKKTISYNYIECGSRETVLVEVPWTDAVQAAVLLLDAERHERDMASWVYFADETQSYWIVTSDDMAALGAGLLDGRDSTQLYSVWCAEHPGIPADLHDSLFDRAEAEKNQTPHQKKCHGPY